MTALIAIAAWLALTWLAYRREHSELVFDLLIERAYAEGMKRKAVVAIERERMNRYDLAGIPVDVKGEN